MGMLNRRTCLLETVYTDGGRRRFLIRRIVELNAFDAPTTSRIEFRVRKGNMLKAERGPGLAPKPGIGVWLLASRLNHSCVSNCNVAFIGDMIIVRATKDLERGTELLRSYVPPGEAESNRLARWGFSCNCTLCAAEKDVKEEDVVKRDSTVQKFQAFTESPSWKDIGRGRGLLARVKAAYALGAGAAEFSPDFCQHYFSFASKLLGAERYEQGRQVAIAGLEAIGFRICESSPADDGTSASMDGAESASTFEVTQWGTYDVQIIWGFLAIVLSYALTAPGAARSALRCAKTAYAMAVGESTTFYASYPEYKQIAKDIKYVESEEF